MTLKSHTIHKKNPQHKQIWEWQDSPALQQAVDQLHKSSEALKKLDKIKPLFAGSQNYAPSKKRNDKES